MKRAASYVLVVLLLLMSFMALIPNVYASGKTKETRAIAIVFDNSGSMYDNGDQAWCRATYAMEVFASMLNDGDTLMIYPMHPITVGGKIYTMDDPFLMTDATQAHVIRDIYTEKAVGTPIESVDCAITGVQTVSADNKYVIVLSDGEAFYMNGSEISRSETLKQLDKRFRINANETITIMYLGIGSNVVMPETPDSEFFAKKKAVNSADVLSALTDMCNRIFGRDTLPAGHISGNHMEIDISMKKMIVFVQGENVADLKLKGDTGTIGHKSGEASTRYGTAGCGNHESMPDTTLQGMMVTYENCSAGSYTIDYSGEATSIEVYYEPDADLDFVFTDAQGNTVDPNVLYAGDYKVSFGMKDAGTGKLSNSDLLGEPHYEGMYSINGEEFTITYDGMNGEVPVTLNMDDRFEARLTVTYLSGYTITKDSSDFGWPDGGIQVAARPAGALGMEISGGEAFYSLQDLPEGEPFIVKVYYEGEQLTGKALESVELKWDPTLSNAAIIQAFAEDHFELQLQYKDPDAPQDTVCGACAVEIDAMYAAQDSAPATIQSTLVYTIEDNFSPVQMVMTAPQDYIVISEQASSEALRVDLTRDGALLSAEDFAATILLVDTGGIEYEVLPEPQSSAYKIKLKPVKGIDEGTYPVKATVQYVDHIGRVTQVDDTASVTLGVLPLWVKWALRLLGLLILIIIILLILHIRVLPTKTHVNKKDSSMIFDGEDETIATTFLCKMDKGQLTLQSKYGGIKNGIAMDVKPGKESYLRKPQARRSAEVKSASVRKYGSAVIQEASIGSIKYILNEDTGRLERMPKSDKPFVIKHGTTIRYSGTMNNAGVPRAFNVTTKLNCKKK